MTLVEVLNRLTVADDVRVQFLTECVLNVRAAKRTKHSPAHTRVEFATTNTQCSDFMTGTVPERVGIVVWVPTKRYNELLDADAVDPHVASTGKLTTRDSKS